MLLGLFAASRYRPLNNAGESLTGPGTAFLAGALIAPVTLWALVRQNFGRCDAALVGWGSALLIYSCTPCSGPSFRRQSPGYALLAAQPCLSHRDFERAPFSHQRTMLQAQTHHHGPARSEKPTADFSFLEPLCGDRGVSYPWICGGHSQRARGRKLRWRYRRSHLRLQHLFR